VLQVVLHWARCSISYQTVQGAAQGFHGAVWNALRALVCGLTGLMCLFISTSSLAACTNPATEPHLQPLGVNLWWLQAARGEPDAGNAGHTTQLLVLRAGRRVWLVGSGPTPAFGAQLACAIRRVAGAAVTDLINTRAAPELAMGNVAFAGARLWALPDVGAAMRSRCSECQARLRAQIGEVAGASLLPGSIRAPNRAIAAAGRSTGNFGPFAWRAFERSGGERVLVLRLPQQRVTLAQGLLWAGDVPDLRNSEAAKLLAAWQELRGWSAHDRVLGEQGGVVDAEAAAAAFDAHTAYVRRLQAQLAPALERGEVWGANSFDESNEAALPGYVSRHPLNVQRLWLEMERALFR